jgi:hypothetical protein
MSSESVCRVTRSWVDVGSFDTCLVVRFMIFTASVRNILDIPLYVMQSYSLGRAESSVAADSGLLHCQSFANSRLYFIIAWTAAEKCL